MYEEKSSIDWKGLFLKVLIVFLIVVIGIKGYTTFKGKDTKKNTTTTETVSEAKTSSTFTANMEKLKAAGAKYFEDNKDKLPKTDGTTVMVSLNDLVNGGYLENLNDEDGKVCSGDSSYVTATLEDKQIKQKSNLVCGDASSYSMAYMDSYAGDNSNYSYTTTTNNGTSSNTTSNTSSNGTSSCTSGTCNPNVSVNTNVSQKVSLGTNKSNTTKSNTSSSTKSNTSGNKSNSNSTKYFSVRFEKNGGRKLYSTQVIPEYGTVRNPGNNSKANCKFVAWYYNGYPYDFDTPVTSDMTLIAKYNCRNLDGTYEDDDNDYNNTSIETYKSTVYSMKWATYGTDRINTSHTLRIPENLDKNSVKRVRIKSISFGGAIDSMSKVRSYNRYHSTTFMYQPNGWEATTFNSSYLAIINESAVDFYYSRGYKTLDDARNNGFDVTWTANSVYDQCSRTFSVNGVNNLCDYGIYYNVTWEYELYN